jgi:hypothetical protein
MSVKSADLFNFAVQTFRETFIPKLEEWGLKVYPTPRNNSHELEWQLVSGIGGSTRILIVHYAPFGIGVYEDIIDKRIIRASENWREVVRRHLIEAVRDAILRLSENAGMSFYPTDSYPIRGAIYLFYPTEKPYRPELFIRLNISPKRLTWQWKVEIRDGMRSKPMTMVVKEKKNSETKDPIEAYCQLIKLALAEAAL